VAFLWRADALRRYLPMAASTDAARALERAIIGKTTIFLLHS
jgi:hypothetical protein